MGVQLLRHKMVALPVITFLANIRCVGISKTQSDGRVQPDGIVGTHSKFVNRVLAAQTIIIIHSNT
jgi:hypothetical protein